MTAVISIAMFACALAAPAASAQSTPDVQLLLPPGTAVTSIYNPPGCVYLSPCSLIVSMAYTVQSQVGAAESATDGDMSRVEAALAAAHTASRSQSRLARALAAFRASDGPTITQVVVRNLTPGLRAAGTNRPATSCPKRAHSAAFWKVHHWRSATRRAFTKLCTSGPFGCHIASRHDSETYWYDGNQAWGGQPQAVHGSGMSCQNQGILGSDIGTDPILATNNDSCDFEPNVASWHNPAFLSARQHLSADDRFHGTAPIKGFGVSQYAHIYFWDYGNGWVCAHVGNEPVI